jgi:hypothetical protein
MSEITEVTGVTKQDISWLVGKIVLVGDEPYPTILEAAYYVGRQECRRSLTAWAAERDMLRHLVYSRALSGGMKTQDAAWRVSEELLDFVEDNPRQADE